jgi:uncharacterized protein YbaR (Trm112 family)
MHILMTDVLVCPRCGPAFGLILLADRIVDRRVLEGRLGCPNCRELYPIRDGEADLRTGGGTAGESANGTSAQSAQGGADTSAHDASDAPAANAARIAALLGVTHGPAYVLLAAGAAAHASDVAALMEDVEVIAVHATPSHIPDSPGISHILAAGLPFAAGKMAGVAIPGAGAAMVEAAARAVRPTGRLLLDPAPEDAEARLLPLGLQVLAREGAVVLAHRTSPVA